MGAFLIVLLQVVLALLLAGALLPLLLLTVPAARSLGPAPLAIAVAVIFILLRLAWPRRSHTP